MKPSNWRQLVAITATILAAILASTSTAKAKILCAVGGYQDRPDPVTISFRGKILIGGSQLAESLERRKSETRSRDTALRVFDPESSSLSNRIGNVGSLQYGVRAGTATRKIVFVAGPQGVAFTRSHPETLLSAMMAQAI